MFIFNWNCVTGFSLPPETDKKVKQSIFCFTSTLLGYSLTFLYSKYQDKIAKDFFTFAS